MNKHLIIILSLILLCSCEYETNNDHFVDVTPPIANKQIDINLAGVKANDTIYIYTPTMLRYQINENDGNILNKEAFLDNKLISNNWSYIYINPEAFDNSIHKVKLSITLKTNTGSLSEKLGMEQYAGEFEFTLKYVLADNNIQIRDDVTTDDYLRISWNKPNIEKLDIDRYEISYNKDWSSGSKITVTITDPNQTYIIDKDYASGYKDYQIVTYFKEDKIKPWINRYTMSYNGITEDDITVENVDLAKVVVSWKKNKYRCIYIFKNNKEEEILTEKLDYETTSKIIDAIFYRGANGSLKVLPEEHSKAQESWTGIYFSENISSISNSFYFSYYACDTKKQRLYGLGHNRVTQFSAIDQKEQNNKWITDLNYFFSDRISCSSETGKIAVLRANRVHILDDKLNTIKEFNAPYLSYGSKDDEFCITNNNRLIISGIGRSRELYVYDINTGNPLYQIVLPTTPYNTKIVASSDGYFICCYSAQNIKVYELSQYESSLIYDKNTTNTSQCDFHPTDEAKLIVQQANVFYTLNVDDQSKTESIEGKYISTDPFTGNIMYYDKDYANNLYVNIMNSAYKDMDRIRVMKDYNVRLYNNVLIGSFNSQSTYSYYKNLSKYLK